MMKTLCVLFTLSAFARGAPSTVPGDLGYVPPVGGAAVSGGGGLLSFFAGKTIDTHALQPAQVISEKVIDVEGPPPPPPAAAKKTVIERTVVPQYVEKTVRVPTYVERTIRVPTYVTKTVKVPAAPSIVEKEISHEEVLVPYHEVKVISTQRPYYHRVSSGGYGAAPGGFSFAAGKSVGPGFFNSIFNIPVQTLNAVNGLLNGLARGVTGGASFTAGKAYSYY